MAGRKPKVISQPKNVIFKKGVKRSLTLNQILELESKITDMSMNDLRIYLGQIAKIGNPRLKNVLEFDKKEMFEYSKDTPVYNPKYSSHSIIRRLYRDNDVMVDDKGNIIKASLKTSSDISLDYYKNQGLGDLKAKQAVRSELIGEVRKGVYFLKAKSTSVAGWKEIIKRGSDRVAELLAIQGVELTKENEKVFWKVWEHFKKKGAHYENYFLDSDDLMNTLAYTISTTSEELWDSENPFEIKKAMKAKLDELEAEFKKTEDNKVKLTEAERKQIYANAIYISDWEEFSKKLPPISV